MIEKSVLIVGNFLSHRTGAQGVCEDLASHLADNGWRIHATSLKAGRVAKLLDMVATAWRERNHYGVAQIDVYSGPAFIWAEAAGWTLRRVRKPFVLTLHGGNLPNFARNWPRRVARLLRSASIVTSPSRYLLEQMRPYRADIRLLPNPLDLTNYTFQPGELDSRQLIWLRAFHSIYNPAMAPRVVARLKKDFPELRLTMIGPDKGDGSLQETQRVAVELGVTNEIKFVGGVPKPQVPATLRQGGVLLNTTNEDNTPISVMEAMASGLCVVSTNVGGLPYLLADGEDALLVPPNDDAAMATALRRILVDASFAQHLAANARRKVERFDWPAILPQWEEIFRSLLQTQLRG
ncbi:MAG: glycosyltransferase family 4 protein [Verrucomicrobia bacterium]|nr:glycosyltransferase family 4 protein [Verrucomicrobiota bacterium]